MFSSPFPAFVKFCCKTRRDYPNIQTAAEEQALISPNAVEERRVHFTLGRAAARTALRSLLEEDPRPVLIGPKREPLWPEGVVGAITHAGDVAMAAVARTTESDGIGIDVEVWTRKVKFEISRHICLASELSWVSEVADQRQLRLIMAFSAKESIFKALYPIDKVFLEFMDAELVWDEGEGAFHATLRKRASERYPEGFEFSVGCQVRGDYVLTHTLLPPPSSA